MILLTFPTYETSVDLETKLLSRNFSQKTNARICFSILTTWTYWKLEIKIQTLVAEMFFIDQETTSYNM